MDEQQTVNLSVYDQREFDSLIRHFNGVWCNGSISDFESEGEGSIPSAPAISIRNSFHKENMNNHILNQYSKEFIHVKRVNLEQTSKYIHYWYCERGVFIPGINASYMRIFKEFM